MPSDTLVSVIIPTYKRPEKLVKALKCVSKQSYKELEVIVIDDNGIGTDFQLRTASALKQCSSLLDLNYIIHTRNMGACAARNTGIESANGKYIAFLDDDDEWFPSKTERQIGRLKYENASVCYCDMFQVINGRQRIFGHRIADNPFEKLLRRGYGLCTSSILVETDALRAINGFDEKLSSLQDYDLLIRLAQKYTFVEVDEPLLNYIVGEDGITKNNNSKRLGHRQIIDKYESDYLRLSLRDGLARHYESMADFELMSKNRLVALGYYFKAIKVYRPHPRILSKFFLGSLFGSFPLERFLAMRSKLSKQQFST